MSEPMTEQQQDIINKLSLVLKELIDNPTKEAYLEYNKKYKEVLSCTSVPDKITDEESLKLWGNKTFFSKVKEICVSGLVIYNSLEA